MVNGLGNLLSFVDTNVSSNNSPYNLNNYSYDDSFANMLNKTQTDYSAPSSVSNKIERHLNTEENQTENNYNSYDDYYNDYNQYDAEENTIEEKVSSSSENAAKKTDETSDNAEEAKSVNNTEEQAENKSEKLNDSSNKDHNVEEKAAKSIDESLKKLRTDYIDLLFIHQPFGDYYGTYRAMEQAYKVGKTRAIGVSNFYPDRFIYLSNFIEIQLVVNQIETHVFQQQKEARKIMEKYGTQIMS